MNVRAIVLVLALFSLLSTATGGYLYYHSAKESAVKEAEADLVAKSQLLNDRIVNLISANQMEARALALFEELQEALLHPNRETLSQANRVLDHFSGGQGGEICYLANNAGTTVASSNRREPESFIGTNYAFRPYFREAIQGTASTYMALGVTSELRGIYFSHPVYVAGGNKPIGVAVIKASVKTIERDISQADGGIALLVHSSGMIFASSRKDWVLNLLWAASPEELSDIAQTQQFGKGPWKWTGLERRADNQAVDRSGKLYKTVEMNLENCPGWRTVNLQSLAVMSGKLVDPLAGWTGHAALILFILVAGAVLVLYGMAQRDILSRKLAEEVLRTERSKFETLAENAPFGMAMISPDGQFQYVNTSFKKMFGYDLADIPTGRDWLRKAYPDADYRHEVIAAWIDDLNSSGLGEQRPRIFTVTCKDRTQKVVHFRPVQLTPGEHLMTCEDITQRWKAEDRSRQSEERYRAVFDNAGVGINVVDLSGKYTQANAALISMLGYTQEELQQLTPLAITHPDDREASRQPLDALAEGKVGFWRLEKRYIKKDGSVVWGDLSISLIRDAEGKPRAAVGIIANITEKKKAQEALQESEERFRTAFHTSPDAVNINRLSDGLLVDANVGFAELTGYTREEVIGKTSLEIDIWYNPGDRDRLLEGLKERGYVQNLEAPFRLKDGRVRIGLISARIIVLNGEPHILSVTRDVDDWKNAEEALSESEKKYKDLFDNSTDLIYTHDLKGHCTSVNEAVTRVLGYTAEECLNLNVRQIIHPDYLLPIQDKFQEELEKVMDRSGPHEIAARAKDGRLVWLEVTNRLIKQKGELVGVHGTARDITARKEAEEERSRLVTAIEQAGETIVVTDSEGKILYVNPAFEVTTGYTRAEAVGKNPRILKSGIQDKTFYSDMWSTLVRGEVWRGRIINKRKDGALYEENATISPIKDKTGEIISYVAVKRDVTAELILQKQLLQAQKMEAIGTLAGGIAHDFNNLLQAILGYADLLLMRKKAGDPDRQKIEIIYHAARDGADLVSRILTFSRKAEAKARPIDLNEEIRRAEKLLQRTVPKMIEIKLVLADDLRIIDADPAQIEQLLLNLAVNAQHAMPDGGDLLIETRNVSLSDEYLRAHLGAEPGEYVLLTVSDTGIGMVPEVLDRIFEPFFTTKTNGEGTGLGLAMVHGIVSQHEGYIGCYSEPGIGTSFKIYFPVSKTEQLRKLAETRVMPAFGDETILLVDDDDRVRDLAQEMIQARGYKVLIGRSGEEALEIYAAHKDDISLVILDLIMPGMGGKKCLEGLLQIDPNVKVLVASGYSSNGVRQDDQGKGCRGFVTKPYDAKDILTAIRKVLDRGQL